MTEPRVLLARKIHRQSEAYPTDFLTLRMPSGKKCKGFSKTEIYVISLLIKRTKPPPLAGSATGEWSGRTGLRTPFHNPEGELGLKRIFLFGFALTH
jgi:hypothetical protein